ncbi:TonB C-terminal domain-containing protein [Archangium violaceum]|uniref:TonB C-terminal domain-containing protein n=1 Tax=Archangium violaceum TaxID=83451 RepID=UPI001952214F|nr:TonB C-terminal domain-containing protein [Archangium violaceum]QRN93070.1 TonB C-terminal domain-containing protein [Archangium violaceum]
MSPSRSRLPFVLAVAASVVLHVFLFLWLREAPPPVVPPARNVVELEFHEVTRPSAPVAQAPAPPPRAPVRKRTRLAPSLQSAPAPQVSQAPPETPASAEPSAPLASDVPSAPPASDFPVRPGSLLPRALPNASAQVAPGASSEESGTGAVGTRLHAPVPRSPDAALRELVAQQKVHNGFVHGYFGELQDVLLAAWRATGTSSRRKSGRTCSVEVRLVQAPSGRLLQASIVYPSCDPSMDQEVLADLRSAAESLPAPPRELIAHRDSISSVYRFAFEPPPILPPLRFDVVDLVDRKAIPKFNPKRVSLVSAE